MSLNNKNEPSHKTQLMGLQLSEIRKVRAHMCEKERSIWKYGYKAEPSNELWGPAL